MIDLSQLEPWKLPWRLDQVPETPFFLYSEPRTAHLIQEWKQQTRLAPIPIHLHFALKASNNPDLLLQFKEAGFGLDIVSGGELNLALKRGFSTENLVFSGVGKSRAELTHALNMKVGLLNIESAAELDMIVEIASTLKTRARVSFRVNPDVDAKSHPYISTGLRDHKFGLQFHDAFALYQKASSSPAIEIKGISVHIGSQLLDLNPLEKALGETLAFAERLKKELNIHLEILDVGGGLGVDYSKSRVLPSFSQYGRVLCTAAARWKELFPGPNACLFSECGRALSSQTAVLVTRAIRTKKSANKIFLVVDASMTELIRPALYQARHEIFEWKSLNSQNKDCIPYTVVGPVCESSDVFGDNFMLSPAIEEGDLLAFDTAGSYTDVMASYYNGRDLPPQYWVDLKGNVKVSVVRKSFAQHAELE
jgi:diaminopimelate decarboxylase